MFGGNSVPTTPFRMADGAARVSPVTTDAECARSGECADVSEDSDWNPGLSVLSSSEYSYTKQWDRDTCERRNSPERAVTRAHVMCLPRHVIEQWTAGISHLSTSNEYYQILSLRRMLTIHSLDSGVYMDYSRSRHICCIQPRTPRRGYISADPRILNSRAKRTDAPMVPSRPERQ